MGRQILFHMMSEDCHGFLEFVRKENSICITERDSQSPKIFAASKPCNLGQVLILWNRNILPLRQRKYIPESTKGPYYRVDDSLPVLEFFLPAPDEWDGRPALTQGANLCEFRSAE